LYPRDTTRVGLMGCEPAFELAPLAWRRDAERCVLCHFVPPRLILLAW
jgi:hypothetical protein